ncbi:MAG: hypothetical protein Q7J35_17865 [Candidatus Methanoperedens sp.]|nr:hypothetical protein [Candidatus Methanoperedens sp.]
MKKAPEEALRQLEQETKALKIQKAHPMNLLYYWYKEGVLIDPETFSKVTGGLAWFKWYNECPGCQIEKECPCEWMPLETSLLILDNWLFWYFGKVI